jgi:hypothetical protein
VAKHALERALDVALFSLKNRRLTGGRKFHSGLACTSGAIGGAFGLPALAVELPITTTIMLRAIAAIARPADRARLPRSVRAGCLRTQSRGAGERLFRRPHSARPRGRRGRRFCA